MSAADGHIPEERRNKNTKKSIAAVVAGALVIIVVTTLVDVLHVVGVFPPMSVPMDDRLSLIATSGGWETARHAA